MDGWSVRAARVGDERNASGEEGDGCLDVGDGGVVCVHLRDSGIKKHTVLDGDRLRLSPTPSPARLPPGPWYGCYKHTRHFVAVLFQSQKSRLNLKDVAFGSSVLKAPTMSFWTLEISSSASRRIGMSEAAVVHVREGKRETEPLREKMP